jgi:hypothetical protein
MAATIVLKLAETLLVQKYVAVLPIVNGTTRIEGHKPPVWFHHGPSIGEHSRTCPRGQ